MSNNQKIIIPVELENVTVYVEALRSSITMENMGDEDEVETNVAGRVLDFDDVNKAIVALSNYLGRSLSKLNTKPTKTAIEFGIALQYESGEFLAIFVQGAASMNFKITLEWEHKSYSA